MAALVGPLWPRVDLLDGDHEVVPGVRTVVTGGHTPGHQMVYVDLASGTAAITGDAVYLREAAAAGLPMGYFVAVADELP